MTGKRGRRRRDATLLDMPDIPMKLILKECDFLSVLSLRKTCHDLRSYLKTTKPLFPIKSITISGPSDTVNLTIVVDEPAKNPPEPNKIEVTYKKNELGCQVIQGGRENWKILEDLDFMEVFIQDLRMLMENPVEKLEFCTRNVLAEKFGQLFKKGSPSKVKEIKFGYVDQAEIMQILPYLCPDTLEKMSFGNSFEHRSFYLTLTQVTETEQWKKCPKIEFVQRISILAPIQNCLQLDVFTEMSEMAWVPTAEDLKFVRNHFLLTPSPFEKFYLYFDPRHTDTQPLYAVLGRAIYNPGHSLHDNKQWMYKKSPEYVVKITLRFEVMERKCFKFEIVKMESLTDFEKLQVLDVEEMGAEQGIIPEACLAPKDATPEVSKIKKSVKISDEKPVINNYEVEDYIDPCHVRVL
ncbi:unnamed protein product [Caenorhabditis brenneri]